MMLCPYLNLPTQLDDGLPKKVFLPCSLIFQVHPCLIYMTVLTDAKCSMIGQLHCVSYHMSLQACWGMVPVKWFVRYVCSYLFALQFVVVSGRQCAACNWRLLGSNKKTWPTQWWRPRQHFEVMMSERFHFEEAFIYAFRCYFLKTGENWATCEVNGC